DGEWGPGNGDRGSMIAGCRVPSPHRLPTLTPPNSELLTPTPLSQIRQRQGKLFIFGRLPSPSHTMPTYEFKCPEGHEFEHFFRSSSGGQAELPCPVCGRPAARQVSGGAGLVFKGSGFYITDYGKDGKKDQKTSKPTGESGSSDSSATSKPSTSSSDSS